MKINNVRELINKDYPIKYRSLIPAAIQRAYSAVYQLKEEIDFLNWGVAGNLDGHLKNIAVEHSIKMLIDNNNLPYEYYIAMNGRKNHKHITLTSGNSTLTISQTKSGNIIPRRADYRVNNSLQNQIMFNFKEDPIGLKSSPYYVILTHGGKKEKVEFIRLGVPDCGANHWIEQLDILNEPYQVSINEEMIQEEQLVTLKNSLKNEVLNCGGEK